MPTEAERCFVGGRSTSGYTVEFSLRSLIVPEHSHAIHGNSAEINVSFQVSCLPLFDSTVMSEPFVCVADCWNDCSLGFIG